MNEELLWENNESPIDFDIGEYWDDELDKQSRQIQREADIRHGWRDA